VKYAAGKQIPRQLNHVAIIFQRFATRFHGCGWGRKTAFAPELAPGISVAGDTSGFLGGGQVGCDYQFAPIEPIGGLLTAGHPSPGLGLTDTCGQYRTHSNVWAGGIAFWAWADCVEGWTGGAKIPLTVATPSVDAP
jgi:hypothetical protein